MDLEGYRDYRGVPVVGAWTFLPHYKIGVATEIDRAEAFRPLAILQWTFAGLQTLLALAALAIFIFSIIVARMQRAPRRRPSRRRSSASTRSRKKPRLRGDGDRLQGTPRRAAAADRHQDAARSTEVTDGTIERFERESAAHLPAQPSQHGRDLRLRPHPRGAVLLRDGVPGRDRPARRSWRSTGRSRRGGVIRILQQVCGSLYEAHSLGLVHRDIKPANIMLNRRGGEPDVAKVLDFGLVKAVDEEKQTSLTAAGSLTGTPLYMSPEAIQSPNSVDPRSDLYAVGAVGYYLLTGKAIFDAQNIVELCQRHVSDIPVVPSVRLGRAVSPELEAALMSCLEKSRAKRPQSGS